MKGATARGLVILIFLLSAGSYGQRPGYWQQHADYTMNVLVDVVQYTFTGEQKLVYTNNSPDTLRNLYYHMYFNAFQPGSEMDIRLRHVKDPDGRMTADGTSRIAGLSEDEIGYLRATSLKQDGQEAVYALVGTVLEVQLVKPLLPGKKTTLEMAFNGQVPVQIRRSGRNNAEGVALTMSQWYPKLAEYDFEGWHADPYIAREFHGVWGDFDVKITIDRDYVVGGSGYLQNPGEVGHRYMPDDARSKPDKGEMLTWHFKAPKVHDFMWAADPEYVHDILEMPDGPTLHFFYKNNPEILENWKNLQPKTLEAMQFFNRHVGPYPYEQYSVIQGGDGGMEYAMSTLITGERKFESLVGVMVHELAHSWFQQVLATNEAQHAWMDEGFTTFISSLCMNEIMNQKKEYPFENSYNTYYSLVQSGHEQPQGTHSDRYALNFAYEISAYSKGAVFLSQLGYIIGQENLMQTLRRYYSEFKFTHPTPNDFIRTAEKVSGLELHWYLEDWTQTTNTIDYAIREVADASGKTRVSLERIGLMPMPVDVLVVYTDEARETLYAPLRMMRGEKENPYPNLKRTVLPDWPWAATQYEFTIDRALQDIKAIVIDPSQLMADVNWDNNLWQAEE